MVDGIVDIPLPGQPLVTNGSGRIRCVPGEFLAGPENALVAVAVRSVLDGRPNGYNPLVFCGPSGSGKSHLAQGLATEWKGRYRRRRVECTTAADFCRELSDAIETQGMDELRVRYRKAVLLVFEDIAGLAGKQDAQEELVHTLDALLPAGSWVIATAPGSPAELSALMPALQSRLAAGLTLPLAAPGPRTRLAILQRLAELREIRLTEPAARILAEGLCGTVPKLLQALAQLEPAARTVGGTIRAADVREYFARQNPSRQPRLREIAAATARAFALRLSDLRGRSQSRTVVAARSVAMHLARRWTQENLEQIGDYFGGRDHTTVMYGCRKVENLLKSDPVIRQAVERLKEKWQSP